MVLKPELSVAVDVMLPPAPFAAAVAAFQQNFPSTLLRPDFESSAVVDLVLDGRCAVGVAGSWLGSRRRSFTHERLLTVRVLSVVFLAAPTRQAPRADSDSGRCQACAPLATSIPRTSRRPLDSPSGPAKTLAPFPSRAKPAFLRAGLGYGGLPLHMIAEADPDWARRTCSDQARRRAIGG